MTALMESNKQFIPRDRIGGTLDLIPAWIFAPIFFLGFIISWAWTETTTNLMVAPDYDQRVYDWFGRRLAAMKNRSESFSRVARYFEKLFDWRTVTTKSPGRAFLIVGGILFIFFAYMALYVGPLLLSKD